MKHVRSIVAIALISSCSQVNLRSTASVEELEILEQSPEQLTADMQAKYESVYYLRMAAYKSLEDFDKHLADGKPIHENPAYPELLAARAHIEALEHDIEETQESLTALAQNEDVSPELRSNALRQLRSTLPGLAMTQGSWGYVLSSLHEKSRDIGRRIMTNQSRDTAQHLRDDLDQTYEAFSVNFGHFQKRDNESIQFQQTVQAAQRMTNDAKSVRARMTIEHTAMEIKRSLDNQKVVDREQRFRPSVGGSGNIVGTEFPAKVWSLTFDDGPGGASTRAIVDNLRSHNIKATFFQLTQAANANRTNALYVRDAGMEIASHSFNHPQVTRTEGTARERQIGQAARELGQLHGRTIRFYRLPYGAGVHNPDIRQRIATAGMIHVFWNVDTLDWQAQPAENIVARTIRQMAASPNDAGVILFHDIHQRTVSASEQIMRHLKQGNRRTCTLGEIVDAVNAGTTACPAR